MGVNSLQSLIFLLAISLLLLDCQSDTSKEVVKSVANVAFGATIEHPLDGLNTEELSKVIAILKDKGHYTEGTTLLPEVTILEPTKAVVYAWKKGDAINRKAQVISREGTKTFEGVVDITNKSVESWKEMSDIQSAIIMDDFMKAAEVWKTDKRVTDELKKRGYKIEDVLGFPLTPGYFGPADSRENRLLKVWLVDVKGVKTNLFAKPINGITPVVDVINETVVDVYMNGDDARNDVNYDYDEKSVGTTKSKPIIMSAPEGNNYSFKDGMIEWDGWKLHTRLDKRQGLIISMASFNGQSVAYQLSLNEMFVPYMDPSEDWRYRSYMDVGEYGFGFLSTSMELGTDVPHNATLLDIPIPTDNGTAILYENVVGIFERNTGRPSWRHSEMMNETHESRPEVELVLRTIPVVGNYDYVIDYVFSAKGNIKVEVGATGMDAVRAAKAKKMDDATALYETKVGNLVAPNLVGVYHDHFLSFRIDLDVAGQNNTLITDEIIPVKYPNNPRKSGWEVVEHPNLTEGPISDSKNGHDGFYRVVNKNEKNSLGQYKGYQIMGHSHLSQLDDNDLPQKRAAWSKEQLWATPYKKDELFPSGRYPNQSDGSEGIIKWTAQQRSIDNTDIVCWYTLGFHHITLPEDWPVLPTMWHSFMIRPAMSFDKNPAIDVSK